MPQPNWSHAHLVGIAGSGLSSLARLLAGKGTLVTGSDSSLAGHHTENLPPQVEIVIHSDAIPPDNPELLAARSRNLPILTYFQALAELTRDRDTIAIAGTHGKSTTAAMTAEIFCAAGLDPLVCYGATPQNRESAAQAGSGRLAIVEACEFRRNFLLLRPKTAAILGIEHDHFDCYPTSADLENAFAQFAQNLPQDGLLLVAADDTASLRAAKKAKCQTRTFGFTPDADYRAEFKAEHLGRYRFQWFFRNQPLGEVHLPAPGRHNARNALAAAALSVARGISPQTIAKTLENFPGLARRLDPLPQVDDICRLDDYAHHPTEVKAALDTARQMYPNRPLWCIFQPHQASRTERLLDDFAASLQNGDWVAIADIYRAREPDAKPGEITAARLADAVRRRGVQTLDVHSLDDIADWMAQHANQNQVLITLGAGNVRIFHDRWMARKTQSLR